MRSRCLHPGQQQGLRWPSSNSSWVRRMRRFRVVSCLASSTQQMNSFRAEGRDVLPGSECREIGDQRLAQVCGQLVHHPTGHSLAAHGSQRNPMCQTVFRQCVHASSLLTSDEGASNMGGCSVFAELPVPQDLGCWGAHADSHILCGPRVRRGSASFAVCELELARIDVTRELAWGHEAKLHPGRMQRCLWVNGS